MTDDPRALAKKVLSSPDSNPLARDCARALDDALDERDGERVAKLTVQAELRAALVRAEAAKRERDGIIRLAQIQRQECEDAKGQAKAAERERDEAWNRCHTCGACSGSTTGCEECSEFMQEAGYTHKAESFWDQAHKADLKRIEAERDEAKAGMQEIWGIAAESAEMRAKCGRYREALEYVASDPRLPNRLKRIITDALSPARSSTTNVPPMHTENPVGEVETRTTFSSHPRSSTAEKRRSQLCECGHHRSTHPYVGRHASWPTRCVYCDCTQFRSSTADEKP